MDWDVVQGRDSGFNSQYAQKKNTKEKHTQKTSTNRTTNNNKTKSNQNSFPEGQIVIFLFLLKLDNEESALLLYFYKKHF